MNEVRKKIKYLVGFKGISMKQIAAEADVSYGGVRKIACGVRECLSQEGDKKLEKYLSQFDFPDFIL